MALAWFNTKEIPFIHRHCCALTIRCIVCLCYALPCDDWTYSYEIFNLLKPTGHVMQQQFNIQQLYALPTLYLCVLYLSENKQRLVPLTA